MTENIISDPRSVVVEQLSASCEELFENYGLKLSLIESISGSILVDNTSDIIGLLGASAEGLRASAAIQTSFGILQKTYPAKLEGLEEQKLQDWIGELSNQLIGRLKNKMLPYGCELTLGVPAVIQGSNLKTVLPKRSEITTYRYSTETGDDVYLFLSTLIDENSFNLYSPDESSEEELMTEGEFIFF